MDIPDRYEPSHFAIALDRMGELMRLEAQRLGPSAQAHSLNVFATDLHKLAVAMDGLGLRQHRTAPAVGARPTDGSV